MKKSLEVVRAHTGKSLDLKETVDREYLKDFMAAIEPVILQGVEAEKKATELCSKAEKIESRLSDDVAPKYISQPSGKSGGRGCSYGFFLSVALFLIAGVMGISGTNPLLMLIVLAIFSVGLFLDATQSQGTTAYKKKLESETKRWEAEKERLIAVRDGRVNEATSLRDAADALRREAEHNFTEKLSDFIKSHG
ncbi:MAG: tripartite tricarboxylate transporter TctB family protein [Synechococcaceae cyanobacterium ELA263]